MTTTIAMIKPCAVASGNAENVLNDIEAAGFTVIKRADVILERKDAEDLYDEHRERAHFKDLVDFTVSGPVVLLKLSHPDDAAPAFRALMGPTKIEEAQPGTLRHKYAVDFRRNAIHGSDSADSASREEQLFDHYFA